MSAQLGVSPIAWANDDMPELGAETTVETILAEAAKIGFAGVELGGRFPRDAAVLAPMLARERLALVGGWWSIHLLANSVEAEVEALQGHLGLLNALGSPVFIAAECTHAVHGDRTRAMSMRPRLQATDWGGFGARLSALAAYAAEQGLAFAYHFHLGTAVENQDDLDRFLDATTDQVGLVVDTGHAALGGIDAVRLIRDHPQRVAHVHAKDVRGAVAERVRAEGRSFLDGVLDGMFTAPGDGDLDFDAVMGALAAIGYGGWIVEEAEQDPNRADPLAYGRLGFATLKEAAEAAGLVPAPAAMEPHR
ncbi:MAG TPA: myo-inosose-2 dehydratase [Caulobacteraceae bacterium]|nr:myo-inosose-2 dehydratase [Caulobacteraceae bacterium]